MHSLYSFLVLLSLPALAGADEFVRVAIRTDQGVLEVELDAKRAPGTVANFLRYVDAGRYDGGRFHRTVRADNQPDNKVKIAVIQAGIAPGKKEFAPIDLERTSKSGSKHKNGTISMARDKPDSATGDFFICVGDQPELDFGGQRNPDGQGFAAFGRVVRGMDVVKKIHQAPAKGQALEPAVAILDVRRAQPMPIAHRGLLRHAPENTLAAFESCLTLRLGFELDVRRSKDGHLVVLHDDDLKRTTDGEGKVAHFSLADLKKLDAGRWFDHSFAGQRIPTLDEVFALVKKRGQADTLVAVDIKIDGNGEADVVKLAKKHGVLSRIVCIGTAIDSPAVRKRLRVADAATPVAVLAQTSDDLAKALKDSGSDWAYLRFVPTRSEVEQIRKSGKRSIVVGKAVAGREIENWNKARLAGVDAILTDYPLECRLSWRERK